MPRATRMHLLAGLLLGIAVTLHSAAAQRSQSQRGPNYYGTFVGNFSSYAHNLGGDVYVLDESTFYIRHFNYDGNAPNGYFWIGKTPMPMPDGTPVPYPEHTSDNPKPLQAYQDQDIILRLPAGIKVRDIKYLSVWCRRFTVNFGMVLIPEDLWIPAPRVLPEFSRLAHGLRSDNITILDSKTFYIPNLHYDGAGPDAYFWVGKGPEPDTHGIKVPNEMNSSQPLQGYEGVDIEIVLPGNLTVYDIDWLAVWCVQYKHNFGHVLIPKDLDVPPALGQTKIAPPWWYTPTSSTPAPEMSNCIELLEGRVQVQWELMGEDVQIRVSGRIRENQYVAFGLSGSEGKAQMIGADVVVVGYNKSSNSFFAEDYYMSEYAQCDGKRGVCPDHRIGGKNDAVFVSGRRENGVTTVTYMRPLRTNELDYDRMIPDKETTIIAAIGLLNKNFEANAHLSSDSTGEDIRIDFAGRGVHQCTNSLYNLPAQKELKPWPAMSIAGEDTFTARIGPTGGDRGYPSITGEPAWGIAWYINEMLIPELTVERGQNYTFLVEGGDDKTMSTRYHPFYITSSREGGYGQLNAEQQKRQRLFAGVARDASGYPYPTAAGRYCEYQHKSVDKSAITESFGEFFGTLRLHCEEGQPAALVWHVEEDTPDLVYYQCYTHRNLGWKIHVVDQGYGPLKTESGAGRSRALLALLVGCLAAALGSLVGR